MLRITRKENGEVVFRISGQLTAENVAEMQTLIAAETKGRRIVLDCADLRSVDGEAVKFLEKWEADSIKLKNCSLYIRESTRFVSRFARAIAWRLHCIVRCAIDLAFQLQFVSRTQFT